MKPGMKFRPRILVSGCLLGKRVRYDGNHQCCTWVVKDLGRRALLIPVCPEIEMGLGVPRDTLRLVGKKETPRMVVHVTGRDQTVLAHRTFLRLAASFSNIDGIILKSRSPSCGLNRVKLYSNKKTEKFQRIGRGLFAAYMRGEFPRVPIADERISENFERRKRFEERVVEHARWRQARAKKLK